MQIPNGKFLARAKTWVLAEIGEKETPAVSVEFVLSESAGEYAGLAVTWDGWLTDASYQRTVESLRHCGWEDQDIGDIQGLDKEVELVIESEEYEGRTYPRVRWVNKPGGVHAKPPMSPERKKSFAAAMSEKIRAFDAAKGRPAPKPANGPTGPRSPEPPPHTEANVKVPF